MPKAVHLRRALTTDIGSNVGANLVHHIRTVSWQMSMPRSNSRSSTFRSESGKRMYIMTASLMTSGEE
jgi:hypothetical protein